MAITTEVTRTFDDRRYVQVEVKGNNQGVRYYKVPVENADSFQSEYKANSKKMYRLSSILNFSAVFGAVALSLVFTKNIASKALKYGISAVAGLAGGAIATISSQKTAVKNHENFLKNYNAEELDYSDRMRVD